jgi:hypothetical protein
VTGLIVVAVIVGIVAVLIVVNAGTSAVIGTAFDKTGRALQDRSKPKGTFLTALSVADALAAGHEAAVEAGADGIQEGGPGELAITFPSRASVRLSAALQPAGVVKVKVGAAKASVPDNAAMSQFLGAFLASLRRRDPTSRQAAK